MKIEFDAQNEEECAMVQRMFNPMVVVEAAPVADLTVTEPPVALGTTRTDNTPALLVPETLAPVGDLDSSGLAWDERIHSTGKTQNNNGTWKLRRGVDKQLVEQVKAEGAAGVVPAVTEAPAPTTPDAAAVFGGAPAPVAEAAALDWPAVCARVSPAMTAGTHNVAAEAAFLMEHGVAEVHLLANRPDLFGAYLTAVGL